VGTGISSSFDDVAREIIEYEKERTLRTGISSSLDETSSLNYIDFPIDLVGTYQKYTCADLEALRSVGYTEKFISIREGVRTYLECITDKKHT
jgi:ADP-L-glycero-D-manno-heptose 6-epimerase